jgi:hypothetical protein
MRYSWGPSVRSAPTSGRTGFNSATLGTVFAAAANKQYVLRGRHFVIAALNMVASPNRRARYAGRRSDTIVERR